MSGPRRLYLADFAEWAGVREATLRGYRARGSPPVPEPDGYDMERGHARPWWLPATVRAFLKSRPGSGRWGERSARHARDSA